MRELIRFTARTLETASPVPFGALIVNTRTGERLMSATNAVRSENDPSSHAELRTVRLACKKLKTPSLAGYTMYSTCEPCPMCMANALWARLDRVVFGATIADANRSLPADSHPRRGSGATLGHAVRRRRPGAARALQHALHAPEHAEGFPHLEYAQRNCLGKA